MDSTLELLRRLSEQEVDFIVVGGPAAVLHGSSMVTEDVDVCTSLTAESIPRILAALRDLHPRYRMNPRHPPVPDDPARLAGFKNLCVVTDVGQIDFLGEIAGIGEFDQVAQCATSVAVEGITCRVLTLDSRIVAKRAMGRPRDRQAVVEFEAIRERIRGRGSS
jgi:predicted nucleotidyltransferase